LGSQVAVVKGERSDESVLKALEMKDHKPALSGWETVLIKVNFITVKTSRTTTDPIVVEAIIRKLARASPMPQKHYENDNHHK